MLGEEANSLPEAALRDPEIRCRAPEARARAREVVLLLEDAEGSRLALCQLVLLAVQPLLRRCDLRLGCRVLRASRRKIPQRAADLHHAQRVSEVIHRLYTTAGAPSSVGSPS